MSKSTHSHTQSLTHASMHTHARTHLKPRKGGEVGSAALRGWGAPSSAPPARGSSARSSPAWAGSWERGCGVPAGREGEAAAPARGARRSEHGPPRRADTPAPAGGRPLPFSAAGSPARPQLHPVLREPPPVLAANGEPGSRQSDSPGSQLPRPTGRSAAGDRPATRGPGPGAAPLCYRGPPGSGPRTPRGAPSAPQLGQVRSSPSAPPPTPPGGQEWPPIGGAPQKATSVHCHHITTGRHATRKRGPPHPTPDLCLALLFSG